MPYLFFTIFNSSPFLIVQSSKCTAELSLQFGFSQHIQASLLLLHSLSFLLPFSSQYVFNKQARQLFSTPYALWWCACLGDSVPFTSICLNSINLARVTSLPLKKLPQTHFSLFAKLNTSCISAPLNSIYMANEFFFLDCLYMSTVYWESF